MKDRLPIPDDPQRIVSVRRAGIPGRVPPLADAKAVVRKTATESGVDAIHSASLGMIFDPVRLGSSGPIDRIAREPIRIARTFGHSVSVVREARVVRRGRGHSDPVRIGLSVLPMIPGNSGRAGRRLREVGRAFPGIDLVTMRQVLRRFVALI